MADQSMQWVDATGAATEVLDGGDIYVTPGVVGRMGPPSAFVVEQVPLAPGQRFRSIRHGVAEVKVPIELFAVMPQRFEAEAGLLSNGATIMADHTGYSGTGFVALAGVSNALQWNVTVPITGSYSLDIRYANGNGAARTLSLYINGVKVTQLNFAATATWDTWGDLLVSTALQAGVNTIALTYDPTDTGHLNIDLLTVSWASTGAAALRASVRAWMRRLDPTRGDGRLRITAPAGDQRELVCRYLDGFEVAVEDETDIGSRLRAILRFTTEQPFWQDGADTVQSWALLTSLATFFPLFPLRLSGSEVFADTVIDNSAGDVAAWPVWTITGPGSNPILRNLTSGMVLSLPVALGAGESVVIDTRPGRKTVTKQDGTNLFGSLAQPPQLWPLLQGSNSIRIELTAAAAGVSAVQLNYRKRYLSA